MATQSWSSALAAAVADGRQSWQRGRRLSQAVEVAAAACPACWMLGLLPLS
jgi:hypothetical protein